MSNLFNLSCYQFLRPESSLLLHSIFNTVETVGESSSSVSVGLLDFSREELGTKYYVKVVFLFY